jgi:alpha-amylase
LYDIGEFDQKGAKATKWGTKEELMELCQEAQKVGVGIYFDAVWLFLPFWRSRWGLEPSGV